MSKFTHTWSKFLVLTIIFNSRLRYLLFWVCSNSQKVQLSPLKRCKQLLILDLMKEVYSLCRKSWSETPLTAISKKEVIEEFGFNNYHWYWEWTAASSETCGPSSMPNVSFSPIFAKGCTEKNGVARVDLFFSRDTRLHSCFARWSNFGSLPRQSLL